VRLKQKDAKFKAILDSIEKCRSAWVLYQDPVSKTTKQTKVSRMNEFAEV
jgi:hypothetical protein